MTEIERIDAARWLLDRQLAWITAADVKAAFIVTLQTALLGGLAAAFSASDAAARTAQAYAGTSAAVLFSLASVVLAGLAVRPQTAGPARSLIFFARICDMTTAEYSSRLQGLGKLELLTDLAEQIHRNAEIAGEKYEVLGWSLKSAFVAAGSFAVAIAYLVKI